MIDTVQRSQIDQATCVPAQLYRIEFVDDERDDRPAPQYLATRSETGRWYVQGVERWDYADDEVIVFGKADPFVVEVTEKHTTRYVVLAADPEQARDIAARHNSEFGAVGGRYAGAGRDYLVQALVDPELPAPINGIRNDSVGRRPS